MTDTQLTGQGWAFPVRFIGPGLAPEMVNGEEEIRQALNILIGTGLGERVMRPDWGSPVSDFLFAEPNTDNLAMLSEKIADTVVRNEPRVLVDRINVDDSEAPNGIVLIELSYTIRDTNTRSNLVYPFYLQENSTG